MCEFEYDDGYTLWHEKPRRAAKPHRCSGCGAVIPRGEVYLAHFSKYEGRLNTGRLCGLCRADRDEFADAHEGVMPPPSGFEEILVDCMSEGEDERARWTPAYEALRSRRMAAASLPPQAGATSDTP